MVPKIETSHFVLNKVNEIKKSLQRGPALFFSESIGDDCTKKDVCFIKRLAASLTLLEKNIATASCCLHHVSLWILRTR